MKFKKIPSQKYKFLSIIILLIIILLMIFFIFYLFSKINLINKYNNIAPSQMLISEKNLITELYFNNTLGEIDTFAPIIKLINNAEHSIEIAMFSFDSEKIKEAIYKSANRGVKVTLILDSSRKEKHDIVFSDLPDNINRIDVGSFNIKKSTNTIYMHHKLLLIDRDHNTEKLSTGSLNFTDKAGKYEQSFFFITEDKDLIASYKKEIDFLKESISNKNKLIKKEYNPWISHIKYTDSFVDMWVSPGFEKNSVKYKTIEEIKQTKESIKIIMWSFTDKEIANALIEKAKEGIPVKIITEDLVVENDSSVVPYLKDIILKENLSNFEIILDTKLNDQIDLSKFYTGFTPFLHHHFTILDNDILIFGTNNWSYWGFYKNDENTIITNNKYLVSEFNKTFEYFYKILK